MRRTLLTAALIVSLVAGTVVTHTAVASTGPDTAATTSVTMPAPRAGESLTVWLDRGLFPNVAPQGCIGANARSTRTDGSAGPTISVPCSPSVSLSGIPDPAMAGWETQPVNLLVSHLANRIGSSIGVAQFALSRAAGVNTWELGPTAGDLVLKIARHSTAAMPALARAAAPALAPIGGTTVCGHAGGSTSCGTVNGGAESILWGAAIGAVAGTFIPGLGSGLGAAIGVIAAAAGEFWEWLRRQLF